MYFVSKLNIYCSRSNSIEIGHFLYHNFFTFLVPIKLFFVHAGLANASGLVSRKGLKAEEDAEVVKRLKKSGAIPFIITNVSELCMWYESANRLYGRTKNPYNTGRIVGGSSGIFKCRNT